MFTLRKKKSRYFCILTRRNNNFFVTLVQFYTKKVSRVISCGNLEGIEGSKKYTTVSVELLGKALSFQLIKIIIIQLEKKNQIIKKNFLKIIKSDIIFIFQFSYDKFIKSFLKGIVLECKPYFNFFISFKKKLTHNGIRFRKKRRV